MGLIKNAGVLIKLKRFSKDDKGINGVGNTAGGKMSVKQGQAT
jgi:hypothetical protein